MAREIEQLSIIQQKNDLSPEQLTRLNSLLLCSQILIPTENNQLPDLPEPPQMLQALAAFAYNFAAQQGKVNLKNLFSSTLYTAKLAPCALTQHKIAAQAHIRQGTISDYVRDIKSMTCHNWEKVVNHCLDSMQTI